jgi:hypothetical protein
VSGGKFVRDERLLLCEGCQRDKQKQENEHAAGHAASVAAEVRRRQVHATLRRSANGLVKCEAEARVHLATAVGCGGAM